MITTAILSYYFFTHAEPGYGLLFGGVSAFATIVQTVRFGLYLASKA